MDKYDVCPQSMSKIFVQYGCSGPYQGRIVYRNLAVLLVRNHTSCLARLAFLFQPSNKNKVGAVSGEYTISCNLGLVRVHKVFHTNCDSNPKESNTDLIVGINFPKAAIEVWFPCLTWQP